MLITSLLPASHVVVVVVARQNNLMCVDEWFGRLLEHGEGLPLLV